MQETLIQFLVRKIYWRRDRLLTPVFMGFPGGSTGKESTYNVGDLGLIPGLGRSLEKGTALHSSVLSLSRKDLRELAFSLCSLWCEDTVRSSHLPIKQQFSLLNSGP